MWDISARRDKSVSVRVTASRQTVASRVLPVKADIARRVQNRWAVVVVLGLLYVVSFVDRLMLALLVEPVRVEFGLSDTQIGVLLGPAFALFMGALALPSGWVIDRLPRVRMIIGGVVLWSTATLMTAFATSFLQVLALRIGVAVGEAILFPAAVSLINDLFERERRAEAISVFVAFGMVGGFGAFILGGAVLGLIGAASVSVFGTDLPPWRVAFLVVSLPGILLAAVLEMTTKEPHREPGPIAVVSQSLLTFARQWSKLFLPLFIAAAASQSIILGISSWMPTLLTRNFDWSPSNAGIVFGFIALGSGLAGLASVPHLANKMLAGGQGHRLPTIAAASVASGTLLLVVALGVRSAPLLLGTLGLAYVFLAGTGTWAIIAIQWLVPSALTGRMSGGYMAFNALVGMGLGPLLVPVVSDFLGGPTHLASGMLCVTIGAGGLASVLFLIARRPFSTLVGELQNSQSYKGTNS